MGWSDTVEDTIMTTGVHPDLIAKVGEAAVARWLAGGVGVERRRGHYLRGDLVTSAIELSAADHQRRVAAGWQLIALEDEVHADRVARALEPAADVDRLA
jgi:hypothetical protein